MGCEAQLALENAHIHAHFFARTILTRNVGHTDLVFLVYDDGSLVGLKLQEYKSLCVAVVICATLFNIDTQTHR